ncbi:MAG: DEAD/DEAH box helicase, partial [Desulfovibrio sp.]|nr:DEAD/DEAH box helicase [Desulfovibrio sp.]
IRADLVLPSTVSKLEKGLSIGTSLFEAHPFTIVSLDYIKQERRRAEFLRVCPECVIVDEAHSCAAASGGRSAKQRYDLVRSLSADPERHMVFVTATPHSGKDDVFRSLLAFLNPRFEDLPEDLGGKENEGARRDLAQHFVQRRRGDIASYMDASTPFPKRIAGEVTWRFSDAEREYFRRALALARENLKLGEGESEYRRRIFWWSALALLRAVTSSPAAASATLQIRAIGLGEGADSGAGDPDALDDEARQAVYDLAFEDGVSVTDTLAGADAGDAFPDVPDGMRGRLRRKCRELAKEAEGLKGPERDSKLKGAVDIVRKLLAEGFSPIVFCRFIDTAEYIADALRQEFRRVAVATVTGVLPPEERENRVLQLAKEPKRILVCTDCLSEGVNLQESFSAVVHYDLSWNPTRHEQREGRVDRYGQPLPEVKVVTYWGEDNPVDGRVLEVLLRKHESIRRDLGVSVPVPEDSSKVMQAILQGLLLHGNEASAPKKKALMLPGMEDFLSPESRRLEEEWDRLAAREQKRSRTVFAQQSVKVEEVARELQAASDAAGDAASAERFLAEAVPLLGGTDEPGRAQAGRIRRHVFAMDAHARGKHPGLEMPERIVAAFEAPVQQGEELLSRTHPLVEGIAGYVMDTALDPELQSPASRSGVMYTDAVSRRTTLLL